MAKKQPEITVHLPEELLRQLLCLCESERRTPNNQILMLIRNSVAYFERSRGRIPRERLSAADISPYLTEEQQD